jgi:DNA repair protein RecN (Recombination protein N)
MLDTGIWHPVSSIRYPASSNMLQELDIHNYALIDRLKIDFSPGLNILTGETGAGKSIIIGAMGLMLGERASTDVIRTGAEGVSVRGTFELPDDSQANRIISEADLKDEEDSDVLLLLREVSKTGRSKCRVNDQSATLSTLREVGDHMIDIHGQHEHQTLFRQERHLDILDNFGGLRAHRQKVADACVRLQKLQAEHDQLTRDRDEKLRQKDLLEFQLKELEDAKLQDGEEEKLLRERQILNNAELIFELSSSIYDRLYNSEEPTRPPVLDSLKSMKIDLAKLHEIDAQLGETQSRFETSIYELEDIAEQMRDYRDTVEFDPRKLSEVEARLDLIYRLKRKYGVNSVVELLSHKDDVARQLEDLSLSSSRIDDVQRKIQGVTDEARELALRLSQQRQHHAERLKSLVEQELNSLGMEKTVFEVQVLQNEAEDGIIEEFPPLEKGMTEVPPFPKGGQGGFSGRRFKLSPEGIDSVEFLISPNVGEELRPLTKIASGGEISRIMLAVKTVLARTDEVTTMIFDEIDVGIGGRIAEVVGRKLKELAKERQVICITHLPQIASLADSHCRVEKKVIGDRTVVEAHTLSDEERVKEIARMLAGEKITDVTVAHAREMIEQAKEA